MATRLRIFHIRDKIGEGINGVVKVIPDKNGVAVSETRFDNGGVQYRFRVKGKARQINKKDGSTMWKTQRMWCKIDEDSPFAGIVKSLTVGDLLYIAGEIESVKYTADSGRTRGTTFCSVIFLLKIGASGGRVEAEIDLDDDDEFDF